MPSLKLSKSLGEVRQEMVECELGMLKLGDSEDGVVSSGAVGPQEGESCLLPASGFSGVFWS